MLTTPIVLFTEPMLSSNNNNTSMIPVLDGSNYGAWSKVMRAFLRAQGLWQFVNGMIEHPDVLDPKKSTEDELKLNKNALNDWDKHDDMAIGHMTLRLSTSIQEEVSALNTSAGIWEHLEEHYGKATVPDNQTRQNWLSLKYETL